MVVILFSFTTLSSLQA